MPSFGDFARQHPVLAIAAPAIGAGVGTHLAITRLLPGAKERRKQMKEERRDPRLWSNLKGMLTGKSREERVAAHKHLGKSDGTILGAMREGFKSQEKKAELAGFFDELSKIAQGGGAAALGTEMLGLPGGMLGGYREGGVRGLAGAGMGGGAGLAAGVGARHLLKKYVTGGEFGRRHPLAATAIESLPLAVGSTLGGAIGSQLLKRGSAQDVPEEDKSQAMQIFNRTKKVATFGVKKPPDPNVRAVATKIPKPSL